MKRVVIGLAVFIILIQFIRPDRSNFQEDPAKNVQSFVKVPVEISDILVRSCNDCHSNTTRWPWYSQIAPASWVIADDVNSGRRHINFSEWNSYSRKKMVKKLYLIAEVAGDNSMPLTLYLNFHAEAKLSSSERTMLANWAEEQAEILLSEDEQEK